LVVDCGLVLCLFYNILDMDWPKPLIEAILDYFKMFKFY
jgi:hypothetical protein